MAHPSLVHKRSGRMRPTALTARNHRHGEIDKAMDKAITRAFRWREMLEKGTHATIAENAAVEKINGSYVCRVLRLTLLAPDLVEAILDGRQPELLQVDRLLRPFPVGWERQRREFPL